MQNVFGGEFTEDKVAGINVEFNPFKMKIAFTRAELQTNQVNSKFTEKIDKSWSLVNDITPNDFPFCMFFWMRLLQCDAWDQSSAVFIVTVPSAP